MGKADYRLCKVVKAEKNAKGLVSTWEVAMRPRDASEKTLLYRSKTLKNIRLAVQILVLIYTAHDRDRDPNVQNISIPKVESTIYFILEMRNHNGY